MNDDILAAAEFETHRGALRGLAYRMLGSLSDAEDMVQETWLRWTHARDVESPRAWLMRVLSRLCLDRLKSARVQREHYYGTWLPEPLVDSAPASRDTEVDESVSLALLLVLEKLSPEERAAFLLHEVFGHRFVEIAHILGKSEPACRKLVSRARRRVHEKQPRFSATREEHEELLRRFLDACRQGELGPMLDLFGERVALYSDGGGKVPAVPKVLTDRTTIARFFIGITRNNLRAGALTAQCVSFNGAPGVLVLLDGQLLSAISLGVANGKIAAIYGLRNPDKLRKFHGFLATPQRRLNPQGAEPGQNLNGLEKVSV